MRNAMGWPMHSVIGLLSVMQQEAVAMRPEQTLPAAPGNARARRCRSGHPRLLAGRTRPAPAAAAVGMSRQSRPAVCRCPGRGPHAVWLVVVAASRTFPSLFPAWRGKPRPQLALLFLRRKKVLESRQSADRERGRR
jgi:hypothetical protein